MEKDKASENFIQMKASQLNSCNRVATSMIYYSYLPFHKSNHGNTWTSIRLQVIIDWFIIKFSLKMVIIQYEFHQEWPNMASLAQIASKSRPGTWARSNRRWIKGGLKTSELFDVLPCCHTLLHANIDKAMARAFFGIKLNPAKKLGQLPSL